MERPPAVHPGTASAPRRGPLAEAPIARWEFYSFLAVLVLALGLRAELLGIRPLWFDEAFSLATASRTLPGLWAYLHTNDTHPIAYYALLHAWIRWFGTDLTAMRTPSLILGLGAVALTWAVGRRLCSPAIGIVAAGLVALHPLQIFSSNEMRMYPLLTVLSLMSTWLVWRAVNAPDDRWRWGAYGVGVALLGYTSYYAALLVPAQVLWILMSLPRRQGLARLALAGLVALACYAPWLPVVMTLGGRLPWAWRFPPDVYYAASLVTSQTFGTYLFGTGTYFVIGHLPLVDYPLLIFPFAVLLGVGVVALTRVNRRGGALVAVSWFVPLALVLVVSYAMHLQFAFSRHLVFIEPFAALLLAGAIVHAGDAFPAPSRVLASLIAASLVLTYVVPAVANVQDREAMDFRWDLAAKYLQVASGPQDAVVYMPASMELPLTYYYRPLGTSVYVPLSSRHWTEAAADPAVRAAIATVTAHAYPRVWFVFSDPWPAGTVEALAGQLVRAGYRPGPVQDFHRLWVAVFFRGPAPAP